jgi:hypothetical protein
LVESLVWAALCADIGSFRPIAPKTPGRRHGTARPAARRTRVTAGDFFKSISLVQSAQGVMKFGAKVAVERYIYRSVLVQESPSEDRPAVVLFNQETLGRKLENLAFIGTSCR